ncbi:MAG: thymidylate synthase [Acidiferrobacterales bacterium]
MNELDYRSREIVGETFDEVYERLLFKLRGDPEAVCSPRGMKIKECLGMNLVLKNPRARLLTCASRETNYGFAVGEFLWYWQGKQDLETMLYYNKRMKDFSDDGKTLNSAYGYRLKEPLTHGEEKFLKDIGVTDGLTGQWGTACRTLVKDPDSRRAVLLINQPMDQLVADEQGSRDVPCTLSLQFFIREDRQDHKQKLHLHVHMRSNDVVWGLTYDLFSFTLFQECMLLQLKGWEKFKDLELGNYYHTAGSIHLYERHFELADKILHDYTFRPDIGLHTEKGMEPLGTLDGLKHLCRVEDDIRIGRNGPGFLQDEWFGTSMPWMVEQLLKHKEKRDAEPKR